MRVALVCPYAWDRFGGVQTHVRGLAQTLTSRGHDVLVLAPSRSDGVASSDGIDLAVVGRSVTIPANGSLAPISFGPFVRRRLMSEMERFKPDVVHIHEPLIPSVSLLAVLAADAPAVGTFHAAAESSLGYAAARPILARAWSRLSVRTAVSDAARDLVARYFPGDYVLTPNGIDVSRFADAEPLELALGPKVLFLGRIERRKGLDVLVQAMARVRDLGATLVVGGTGSEERRCRRLADQLHVPAVFLGRVDDDAVPRLYRAADVYCAPGLGGESFGIVLIEAMASGAPVVCSDLPGFRSVASGAAAFVPPGKPDPLAHAIRKVLTAQDESRRMRTMSRRMAGLFDWNRLVAGVEAVYQRAEAR